MPITNFTGDTFVAFMDISGFKELMKENKAISALDKLYTYGYNSLINQNSREDIHVEGMFVSDAAVLFVHSNSNGFLKEKLEALLYIIQEINKKMLQHNYMLTTSVAYGEFSYQNRIEFEGVGKSPIYGGAYVKAFLDNENTQPKIQPGQCRILIDEQLNDLLKQCENSGGILELIRVAHSDRKHLRFYWNVKREDQIEEFENRYKDAYNAKYAGMLEALKSSI